MFCSRTADIYLLVTADKIEDGSLAILATSLCFTNGLIHIPTSNELGTERFYAKIRINYPDQQYVV